MLNWEEIFFPRCELQPALKYYRLFSACTDFVLRRDFFLPNFGRKHTRISPGQGLQGVVIFVYNL